MADVSPEPRRTRLTPQEIAPLLLMNEQELNRRILWDLAANPRFGASYLAFMATQRPRELPPSAADTRRGWISRFFRTYKDWKNRILGFPGRQIAAFIRAKSLDGGLSLCRRINYCSRMARIKQNLGMLKEVDAEKAWAAEQMAEQIKKHSPGLLEMLSDFVAEATGMVMDTVIPVSLLIKLFKSGLDDLCPCCPKCLGTGRLNGAECPACKGDGLLHPFPKPA